MKKYALFLVLFALVPNVYGAMAKLDLETLWAESDAAVLGTVTGIETQRGANGMIYSIIIIEVEEHFIQPSKETTIRVRVEGGEIGTIGVWVEDQPEFHIGEHVFVFLYVPEEIEGDYDFSVYGSLQGKFDVDEGIATSKARESFTIPDPKYTMRDTIRDSYIWTSAIIAAVGAVVLDWSLRGNQTGTSHQSS